ncbi:MAG: RHS repeat domain-containing protein, partial [Tepidisphaeraceae bacterium]
MYDYEYDAEGNRIKRTHRLSGQVTTYVYDHRNRLTEVTTGEAVTTDLGTVTPLVKVAGQGETPPPVAHFNGGADVPAGVYAVEYVSGAIDFGWSGLFWTVNSGPDSYRHVIVSDGEPIASAPGTSRAFPTVADVEALSMGRSVTIDHAGGPLGVQVQDTLFSENLGGVTFRLRPASIATETHEKYAYDTSDRRVVKEVDVDNNETFGDAIDTKESFVYDGDAIALVFDKTGAIQNRYLHGPGMDNVLAEENVAIANAAPVAARVTPDVTTGESSYFGGGRDYPAGTYTIAYVSGATDYTQHDTLAEWQVNYGGANVYKIVSSPLATATTASSTPVTPGPVAPGAT